MRLNLMTLVVLLLFSTLCRADEKATDIPDADLGGAHQTIMDETPPGETDGIKIDYLLGKGKGGRNIHGKIVLKQLPDHVRIEFEGWDFYNGNYALVTVRNCSSVKVDKDIPMSRYKAMDHEIYNFWIKSEGTAIEKSSKEVSLKKDDKNFIGDKSIVLFQLHNSKDSATPLLCKPIQ